MQYKNCPRTNKPPKGSSSTGIPALSGDAKRCQILAKKGFLSARGLTSGVAVIVYSRQFQLGVLLHLSRTPEAFANSAMTMILSEFQSLGVKTNELVTYVVGAATEEGAAPAADMAARRCLWNLGLVPSACDVGGNQMRSVWLDVETGRIIVRSERIHQASLQAEEPVLAAS